LGLALGFEDYQFIDVSIKGITTKIGRDDLANCRRFNRGLNNVLLVHSATWIKCFNHGVLINESSF